jgi:hypothetical protein
LATSPGANRYRQSLKNRAEMNAKISLINIFIASTTCLFISCKKAETKLIPQEIKTEYLVNKKEVSNLINFCINSKAKIFNNCDHFWDQDPIFYFTKYDSLQITEQDSIFSKEDLNFIFKQASVNPQLKLDGEIIPKDKLVALNFEKVFSRDKKIRNEYLETIRQKYNQVCTLSIPLFSRDRNIAIVKIGYTCGGLCGEGGIYIYKKENDGSWRLFKSISDWVS